MCSANLEILACSKMVALRKFEDERELEKERTNGEETIKKMRNKGDRDLIGGLASDMCRTMNDFVFCRRRIIWVPLFSVQSPLERAFPLFFYRQLLPLPSVIQIFFVSSSFCLARFLSLLFVCCCEHRGGERAKRMSGWAKERKG